MKIRVKPLELEAACWLGDNWETMRDFAGEWGFDGRLERDKDYSHRNEPFSENLILREQREGSTYWAHNLIAPGDWVIKDLYGKFHKIRAEHFDDFYEVIK